VTTLRIARFLAEEAWACAVVLCGFVRDVVRRK
jgi:hypothetical protein